MTEQLIFPVLWSTQYNPYSVILFNNETINFQFFWSNNYFNIFRKQINYIKSTTNEISPIFYLLYYSSAHPRSNPLGDKAMLKSCDYGMAYFDVLRDKLRCHFLRINLPITAQTSMTG